ncbi:MAG: prepilin-type N-terminal cleavage/methylation domain-containing protein [Tissierellales bacterium]
MLKILNKGFTLVELIISLALTGLVITIILSIFISDMTMFHINDKDIELQHQGQFILGFLEDKIIESTGITYLNDSNGSNKHETNEKVNLKKIIFKNIPGAEANGYIFQLSKDPKHNYLNLKYGKGLSGSPTVEVGNYIEKIEVEPIPQNSVYTEAKGLALEILFDFDGSKKTFRSHFLFRNYNRR